MCAHFYNLQNAEDPAKKGICSNFLCDAKPGDEITMTGEQPSHGCSWTPAYCLGACLGQGCQHRPSRCGFLATDIHGVGDDRMPDLRPQHLLISTLRDVVGDAA
jgi:hypothetical protein